MSQGEDIKELEKTVYGENGSGLCDRVTKLEVTQQHSTKTMNRMDDTVLTISKAVSEYTGAQKMRSRVTNVLLTIISVILATIGTTLAFAKTISETQ